MSSEYHAVVDCRLIDGRGGEPLDGAVMLIRDGLIKAVGPASQVEIPPQAERIEASGRVVMPGLIDAHVHLMGLKGMAQTEWILPDPMLRAMRSVMDAWKVVDAGFTTVRDCGGVNGLHLKEAVNQGDIVGPRIVAAGRAVTQTGGHGDLMHGLPPAWSKRSGIGRIADGVGEVRRAVREQLRAGADFVKMMTTGGVMSERDVSTACQFSLEEIRAMVEEAGNVGVRTSTHAQGTRGIKNALICGVDCIEHGFYLDDECLELMVKNGSFLIPALAIVEAIVTQGPKAGVAPFSVHKAKIAQEAHLKSFIRAYRAGVTCGLGTDYLTDPMTPMGRNATELALYVERAGLSPMEAIVCATKNNAQALDLADSIGTLEPGKEADFLLVEGDPSKDIKVLTDRNNITAVFRAGRPVPRLEIQGLRGAD